jgi:hypothetical protein
MSGHRPTAVLPAGARYDAATVEVRGLASRGTLAAVVADATRDDRRRLIGATYGIAMPVVFARLTQGLERRRGHPGCATSPRHLAADCLDRFEDDVEAVVHDVVQRAERPIENLEAWIASRINAATVDAHRRRRGELGALQRPRPPKWLVEALGGDRWLVQLAVQLLIWVGNPATAGTELWPTQSWAVLRSEVTGNWDTAGLPDVRHDIETVLAAMRRRPAWYASCVERPLGRKQAPVLRFAPAEQDGPVELPALELVGRAELDDAYMRTLAYEAVVAIRARLRLGEEPQRVVAEVIRLVFGGDQHIGLDRPPHLDDHHGEYVDRLLRQRAELDRIVAAVLTIVTDVDVDVDLDVDEDR